MSVTVAVYDLRHGTDFLLFAAKGDTVGNCLRDLGRGVPGFRGVFFNRHRVLKPTVLLYVLSNRVRETSSDDTVSSKVKNGDEIHVFVASRNITANQFPKKPPEKQRPLEIVYPEASGPMLNIKVHLGEYMRPHTGDKDVVDVRGRTIHECLEDVERRFPGLKGWFFNRRGNVSNRYLISVNRSEDVLELAGNPNPENRPLHEGDELYIGTLACVLGGFDE